MPYVTGTANSATDLRNAIVNAATAHGWTWDSTNNMLYKGAIYGRLTVDGLNVWVQAALGYVGGTLTTPAPVAVGITNRLTKDGGTPLSYPVTYHIFIHTSPDDIIVAVNYQVVWWQWLALGQATNLGVPGSAVWHWGTATSDNYTVSGITLDVSSYNSGGYGKEYTSGAPFWGGYASVSVRNSAIHLNFGGSEWWVNKSESNYIYDTFASHSVSPLLTTQPNQWNGEAVLIRMHVMATQPSSLWTYVAELPHLRMTRNDNIADGQIMTLGSEKWFIAPVYRKNTSFRDRSGFLYGGVTHSGTIAMAIRYDGP